MAQDTHSPAHTQQTGEDVDDAPEHELPMLAGIAACLRWLEELAGILAGPLLTIGLAIALIDLLTDGGLLASQPELLYAWAVAMAAGVDAQLVGSAAKAAAAIRARRPWAVFGYLLLVGVLAYVAYVASLVFSTQEASGITTAAALARLGMDSTSWLWQRSALAVVLVILSGFLRYVPPAASASARAADERAKLERELELEPLRQQLRVQQALGGRAVLKAVMRGTNDAPDAPDRDRPPTGPGTPAAAPVVPTIDEPDANPVQAPAPDRWNTPAEDPDEATLAPAATALPPTDLKAARKMAAEEARRILAFRLLDASPQMSRKSLRTALRCGMNRANELYAAWEYERTRAARSAAR